ncbi:MAG TPA: hypothetical protein VG818_04930, partial [Gemmatimonadaceae bacterium]|nr:hypothetical protein [Gemmatimonadaceae bacterium]
VLAIAASHGVPARAIGTVQASDALDIRAGSASFRVTLAALADAYYQSIPRLMSSTRATAGDSSIPVVI